mmetsp:Transcript_24106/g.21174  ORF Transcript_24106/g.21174 Transcript_24106/m.21174 type:complete len:189 (+) Transcript_24106:98-664(+)
MQPQATTQENKLPHPFEDEKLKNNHLNILLVSDIHMGTKKLEKLKSWFYDKYKQRVHYVFASGDFDNIDNNNPSKTDNQIKQYENLSNILAYLEFASVPIIYIPGNHDVPEILEKQTKLTQHSILIQNASYKLAEGLQVVGCGGSIPAFTRKNGKSELFWEGYPYSSDNDFGVDLRKALDKNCADKDM